MSRLPNGRFPKGTGGRATGTRNRLQGKFIAALAKDFEVEGEGVIRIVRKEKPHEYLKLVASLLPKEFIVSDGTIDDISEEELVTLLDQIRQARKRSIDGDATGTLN